MPSKPANRIPELDLLRFLAATMVLVYHFTYRPTIRGVLNERVFGGLQSVSRFGYLGLALFFMISGFVILWTAQARTAGEFAIARIARLYPTYWVCMFLTAFALMWVKPADVLAPLALLANLTMMPGLIGIRYIDGVYWTLFLEMKFYLLIFLILALRSMKRIDIWLGVWLLASALCVWFPGVHRLKTFTLYPYGPYFISGCLYYLVRSKGPNRFRIAGMLAACLFTVLVSVHIAPEFIENANRPSALIVAGVILLYHAIFLAIAFYPGHLPYTLWWSWLGSLTYPLYLIHNEIGKKFWNLMPASFSVWNWLFLMTCFVYLLAGAVAAVIECYVHKPFQRWLSHVAGSMKLVAV